MKLRRCDFCRLIDFDQPLIEKVLEHGTDRGKFTRLCTFITGEPFVAEPIVGKMAQKYFNIGIRHALQIFQSQFKHRFSAVFFMYEKVKENTQIINVIETRQDACPRFDPA